MSYDPPRQRTPKTDPEDPLEIQLALNLPTCGTCGFFWPDDPALQPYGPYPAYDFENNSPHVDVPHGDQPSFKWLDGVTRPPVFPDAEIMDGCRKAPIMTIGINPNLTAFLPGRAGAAWCYPSFSSDHGTDARAKYAYYYRYRSVYQESFEPGFINRYLLPEERVIAQKAGVVLAAERPTDAPSFSITVKYDGEAVETKISVPGRLGEPRYVLLFDVAPPHNRFCAGDAIAARVEVPSGVHAEIYAQQVGYYERMRPVLDRFEVFLHGKGRDAQLRIGEDVCQLDMVACASPHWGPQWLGGSPESVRAIIANCVHKNAWALKQLVQTQPSVLFLVGEASYSMFRVAFGHLIQSDTPLPDDPEDGAFTLLRATTEQNCRFSYATRIDGRKFSMSTRLVVSPHFSYASNFLPQFRMSQRAWTAFKAKNAACADFLTQDQRFRFVAPEGPQDFVAIEIVANESPATEYLKQAWPSAAATLESSRCDAIQSLAGVLSTLYEQGELSFSVSASKGGSYLSRAPGPCRFCVNDHWRFPEGCPYGKPDVAPFPKGFLEKVAAEIVQGAPARPVASAVRRMLDDGFETRGNQVST